MEAFLVLFATLLLSAFLAVAADQPQPPAAGNPAPAFTLPNQEGAQVSLDQFKGKWIVLYSIPRISLRAARLRLTIFSVT